MFLISGLGNPGSKYAGNRHNIGFMAVDEIARQHGFPGFSKKFSGEIAEGMIGGEKVLLLKPLTFMNESGRSVGEAARFYKIEPKDIVVIHDELDLAPGKMRVKTGGGHGGHNGLKSIDAHLGTRDYRRVRLGIGHPGSKERVNPHVLGDFAKVDREWLEPFIDAIARHIDSLVAGEDAMFMNKVSVATGGREEPAGAKGSASAKPAAKGKSHIRQARGAGPQVKVPEKGPMADMLKRLFGGKD
ncbi:aminoacyl-tRNA hydrolase [Jiella mangrovi]|uniref:Peptidyl-tRNA hydrolase n=1 Tax=Jiella mangrovi TaxID=2821407 RepID=A0ABS4BDL9_9HYPH|nr:aminoacyl-tRNA hydrolase [Jiella mangrovi]MBP0614852.1 aminoacyl-tRNA hydrolase [Jiella mangrovi]